MKIKDPYADSDTLVAEVPSPNPVSNTVGETDGFGILYPLAIGGSVPGPISVNTQGHTTNLPGLRFHHQPRFSVFFCKQSKNNTYEIICPEVHQSLIRVQSQALVGNT